MLIFVARKAVAGLVLVFVIATITFFLLSSGGTSVARTLLGETASPAQISAKLHELGLDRNIFVQYGDWLSHAVRGDFGVSWLNSDDVTSAVLDRLPVTLSLAVGAVLVTALISVALGVFAAVRRGWVDRVVQVLAVGGFAVPGLWLAMVLILWLAIDNQVFPATGYVPFSEAPWGWVLSITLPIAAIVVSSIAGTAQQVRSAMIGQLDSDYVRTLRSRGLPERSVVFKHALRNAAPTGLTVVSLHFISLVGSTVVIEKIFALPGIGSMVLNATLAGDSPQVLGVVVFMVLVVIVVNLVIDIAIGWLNPKVRVA